MAVTRKITLSIDSELDHIGLIGLAVNKICRSIPLTEVDSYQVELCVVEAVTNCVEHAYQGKSGNTVHVDIDIGKNRVGFTIRDAGITMKKPPIPSLNYDPSNLDELPEGGMGLFIIHAVMDDISYRHSDGENHMHFSKCFSAVVV